MSHTIKLYACLINASNLLQVKTRYSPVCMPGSGHMPGSHPKVALMVYLVEDAPVIKLDMGKTGWQLEYLTFVYTKCPVLT